MLLHALLVIALSVAGPRAQALAAMQPPVPHALSESLPRPDPAELGPEAATQIYLNSVPSEKRARSDAYFEGGYWLKLWGFLWSSLALLVLLHFGLSAWLRDRVASIARSRILQPGIYWMGFLLFTSAFAFPWTVYVDFVREHQYGLSTQTFAAWLGDQAKGLALGLVLGGVLVMVVYAVLRRTGRTWWLWASVVLIAFFMLTAMIAPVFINPIFNTYEPLRDPSIRERILSLARANGIAATEVWQMDASRQTTRISANVSGMLGTERITLNDNLLKRTSPAAVQAVMGHEIGHYVLNHVYELVVSFALVIVAGFALTARVFPWLAGRFEARWGVRDIADPAGLPLVALILGAYFFFMTPVTNSIIRINEAEADLFGLNAAGEPEGFVEASLLLGEYRKLQPGRLEEIIFFDHPSGYARIRMAMQYKAEQARRGSVQGSSGSSSSASGGR